MAYVTSGGWASSANYKNTKDFDKVTESCTINTDNSWALCIVPTRNSSGYLIYVLYGKKLKESVSNTLFFSPTMSRWKNGELVDSSTTQYSLVQTKHGYGMATAWADVTTVRPDVYVNGVFATTLPKFATEAQALHYLNTGDTSDAIKDASTKWNLYIDGTKNPLYKLTWNCPDVKSSDTSKVKVLFCASDDTVANTYIVKESHYYDYNNKSIKLNYHDIHEAVWGDMGGLVKGAVTIIVQFEYFETTTVVPKDTSAYMYCELYPNEKNGHMYGNIGFCKVGEHSTWFVKTDSGDESTFTAHDGTEGSDGYTKDDDKGYDDNKDKDDDDNDTKVLSSGIGVLTSTFHMTKERLVQLGQFLWGSSIFDEFSLINNNPIENIISCKAIPYAISGTTQEITLGNVKTGVNGEKISQNFSKQTIGSVAIAEHYKNFLDYAPYTNVIIYLPYIGFKELDTSLVMGKTLRIEYTLDVITGGCLAQIYVGKIRLYEFTGNIGVDISITASNRAQVESAYINAGVGVVSSAMSGNVTGAVNSIIGAATSQYHYSGTGNPSPSCVASTNRTCYVVIDRPQYQPLKAFNHTRGRMCCLSKTIGSLKGYTVCDGNIDISGISATDEEKEEIVNILSSGFFA